MLNTYLANHSAKLSSRFYIHPFRTGIHRISRIILPCPQESRYFTVQSFLKTLTMPRFLLIVLLTACFALPAAAQNVTGIIRGTVTDTVDKQSMTGATVSLTDLSDSTSAGY